MKILTIFFYFFLRKLLNIPHCVDGMALHSELGQSSLEVNAWFQAFRLFIKLHLSSRGYLALLKEDPYRSTWFKTVFEKLLTLDVHLNTIQDLGLYAAFNHVTLIGH